MRKQSFFAPPPRSEPGRVLGRSRTLVLLAVLAARGRGRMPSVTDLARVAGRHRNAVWHHLLALRREGLVTWEAGTRPGARSRARTLRPTCTFTPA